MKTAARTANGYAAEHLAGDCWLIRTDTTRFDLIRVAEGHTIDTVTFGMWIYKAPDASFVPVAHANRWYDRTICKPSWHIADEGQFEDQSTPCVKDLKEIFAIRAANHVEKEGN